MLELSLFFFIKTSLPFGYYNIIYNRGIFRPWLLGVGAGEISTKIKIYVQQN